MSKIHYTDTYNNNNAPGPDVELGDIFKSLTEIKLIKIKNTIITNQSSAICILFTCTSLNSEMYSLWYLVPFRVLLIYISMHQKVGKTEIRTDNNHIL